MKIVNIIGGLGNQMFQYALALALKEHFPNEDIRIDVSHFNQYNLHNGFEIERVFGQTIMSASPRELLKVTYYVPWYKLSRLLRRVLPRRATELIEKQDYVYDETVFLIKGDCYYEGYWQSAKYFEGQRDSILSSFTFPIFTTDENIALADELSSLNSVTIHIRRGDYVDAANYKNICGLEYYERAIRLINSLIPSPSFFIMSNDIPWCEEYIRPLVKDSPIRFITNNVGKDSFRDMQLMSLARACILANSSFSWWGAYLNQRQDSVIVAPRRWVNSRDSDDIYLENWIKI